MLDGEYFFQQAVSAVQFLSELGYDRGQHLIPELIVVGVVKGTRERLRNGESLSPKPLVITLGSLEGGDMDGSVRKLFAPLLMNQGPSNLTFTLREIPDEGHGYVPYKAYYDGLPAAFAD